MSSEPIKKKRLDYIHRFMARNEEILEMFYQMAADTRAWRQAMTELLEKQEQERDRLREENRRILDLLEAGQHKQRTPNPQNKHLR